MAEMKVLHTDPVCPAYNYAEPQPLVTGEFTSSKPKNTYCLFGDESSNAYRNSIRDQIKKYLQEGVIDRAIFSFYVLDDGENRYLSNAVCNASYSDGAIITFMFNDRGSTADTSRIFIRRVSDCVTARGLMVEINSVGLGGRAELPSMHNKFLLLTFTDARELLVFSTGHFRFGTTINFDSWVFYRGDDPYLLGKHRCLGDAVLEGPSDFAALERAYLDCLRRLTVEERVPYVRYFQLPFERDEFGTALGTLFHKYRNVDIEMSLANRGPAATLMLDAARSGARMRVLLDDDFYWAMKGECGYCYVTKQDIKTWFDQLLNMQNVEVRYLQTANQHCLGNFVHGKNAIFYDGPAMDDSVVLTGSLNFTRSALTRNMENAYIITSVATEDFAGAFERRWGQATRADEMPATYDPKPVLTGFC